MNCFLHYTQNLMTSNISLISPIYVCYAYIYLQRTTELSVPHQGQSPRGYSATNSLAVGLFGRASRNRSKPNANSAQDLQQEHAVLHNELSQSGVGGVGGTSSAPSSTQKTPRKRSVGIVGEMAAGAGAGAAAAGMITFKASTFARLLRLS
jgi:hypothetical protein